MSETVSAAAAAGAEFAQAPRRFRVVCNDEEYYSIWPENREIPAGWQDAGVVGEQQECLDHIERVWKDMRPLSLRRTTGAI